MEARDIMRTNLITVSPKDTVIHAAELMLEHRISGLPMLADDGSLIGIVTEGDLIRRVENDTDHGHSLIRQMFSSPARLAAEFRKTTGRLVRDVMTRAPITGSEATALADISELFARRKIKQLPITRGMRVMGIVTRADLLRALVGSGVARAGDLAVVDY